MTDIVPSRLILFDGVCNLCNGAVLFIIARDPLATFSFTSLQSDTGQRLSAQYNLPTADFNSFIYIRDGRVYQKSQAALNVLKDMRGFWQLCYIFILIPSPVRDMLYDLVARYRYSWFGKKDSCMVPTLELQKRFLS
jgi:predicted DCC family thiol-disulfide oxidoreductase YuxK